MTQRLSVLCITEHSDRPEAETFIGLKNEGVDVNVLCSPKARHFGRLVEAGVRVVPLEIAGRLDAGAVERIRAELRSHRYDVVHLYNNKTVLHGLIATRGYPAKIVVYRGIVGNVSVLSPFSWLRYLNPRVGRIVCVAEAVRRYFLGLRFFGWRLAPHKVVTIYKGHDLAWYRDPPADLRAVGIPQGAFTVCCVANWRPRKGVEVLIEAFTLLPSDAEIHLALVGDMRHATLEKTIKGRGTFIIVRQLDQVMFRQHASEQHVHAGLGIAYRHRSDRVAVVAAHKGD